MRNIDLIREVTTAAAGNWPYVLAGLSIDVPDSSRRHAPCPACGGTDRFRFDDNGRGSFICNQCGAGDGLDLIKRVNNCDTTEAAQLAADVLGIDYRAAETDPTAASQRREQLESDRQQRAGAPETGSRGRRAAKGYVCPSVCRNAPERHTGRI
jgi:putative DNA primase/helicase